VALKNFLQGTVGVADGISAAFAREARRTAAPQTAVELVHGLSGGIVAVHQVIDYAHFAFVSDGVDAML